MSGNKLRKYRKDNGDPQYAELEPDGLFASYTFADRMSKHAHSLIPPVPYQKRICAFVVDTWMMQILVLLATALGMPYYPYAALYAVFLYKPTMEFLYGGTLGKKILGLCVTNLDGKRITLQQAYVRNVGFVIMGVLVFLDKQYPVIAPVPENITKVVGIRKDKRMLHDVLANSHCWEKDDLTVEAVELMNRLEHTLPNNEAEG